MTTTDRMTAQPPARPTPDPAVIGHALYAGKDQDSIVFGPRVKAWNGWPQDVVDTLRRWNGSRGLAFIFTGRVFQCPDCHDYIDSRGVAACKLNGTFICDDCIVQRARAAA